MEYLYLITAIWLAFSCLHSGGNTISKLLLQFPALILALVFGILAAKGFGVI